MPGIDNLFESFNDAYDKNIPVPAPVPEDNTQGPGSNAGEAGGDAPAVYVPPVKSVKELELKLLGRFKLSDVPEPLYRSALYWLSVCEAHLSKNGKDLLINKPPCDFVFEKPPEGHENNFHYSPSLGNILTFSVFKFDKKKLFDYKYPQVRIKAEDRRPDGKVLCGRYIESCTGDESNKDCYIRNHYDICPLRLATYLYLLRQLDPDEEKRQRAAYKEKEFLAYGRMEALSLFDWEFLSSLSIPCSTLRLVKRMVDSLVALPVKFPGSDDNWNVCIKCPKAVTGLFSADCINFSVETLESLFPGDPGIAKLNTIQCSNRINLEVSKDADKREKDFLSVLGGDYNKRGTLLFWMVIAVYELLQSGHYEEFYKRQEAREADAVKALDNVISLGSGVHGFYGLIVASDKQDVDDMAEKVFHALQMKNPQLDPHYSRMPAIEFMESLVEGERSGFSDPFGVKFSEPKLNHLYILDNLGFWLRYVKYKDKDYTHLRSHAFMHLLQFLKDYHTDTYIVFAGNRQEIDGFLGIEPVFKTLFGENMVETPDDSPEKLYGRFMELMEGSGIAVEKEKFLDYVSRNTGYFPFRNRSLACYLSDYYKANKSFPADFNTRNLKAFDAEIDSLVGLSAVKEQMRRLNRYMRFVQQMKEFKVEVPAANMHMLFIGNPGTGKTTVARIVAKMMYDCGICKKDKLVEVQATDLIGRYLGQTAPKTKAVIDSALDGVLFVDEAYAIISGSDNGYNDYGKEAISVLIKAMEDNKDRLVVIFAGYGKEMEPFIKANPGMESRIGYRFVFNDYSSEELTEIFCRKAVKSGFKLAEGVREKILSRIKGVSDTENFGNGRFIDKVLQETLIIHSMRTNRIEDLSLISEEDVPGEDFFQKAMGTLNAAHKQKIGFSLDKGRED